MKNCSITECERAYYCKGYCHLHYRRSKTGVDLNRSYNGYQRGGLNKTCPHCQNVFTVKKSQPQLTHCSRKCAQSTKKGAANQNWKGGITDSDRSERNRFAREIRDKIFTRDNYTCQMCDAYGVYLQVDHIKRWADYPELRFELDNCRTLCRPCHYYITLKRAMPNGSMWGIKYNEMKREN